MNGRFDIYASPDSLSLASAEFVAALLVEAVKLRGRATIALSGGSTPRSVYMVWGSEPLRSMIPWKDIHVFWGDERCVPRESPESNFRMVKEALLDRVLLPGSNVHRIEAEKNPEAAARAYEKDIRAVLQSEGIPRFDVVLLGLGEDGHTASLFPDTTALQEQKGLVTDVFVNKLNAYRITMTLPLINNAHHVVFIVSGRNKAGILSEVFQGNAAGYPAQLVHPVAGDLVWLVDRDAVSQLKAMSQQ